MLPTRLTDVCIRRLRLFSLPDPLTSTRCTIPFRKAEGNRLTLRVARSCVSYDSFGREGSNEDYFCCTPHTRAVFDMGRLHTTLQRRYPHPGGGSSGHDPRVLEVHSCRSAESCRGLGCQGHQGRHHLE